MLDKKSGLYYNVFDINSFLTIYYIRHCTKSINNTEKYFVKAVPTSTIKDKKRNLYMC